MPVPYSMQVDDCMFADIKAFIQKTAGISIVSLKDVAGSTHLALEHPFYLEKWN